MLGCEKFRGSPRWRGIQGALTIAPVKADLQSVELIVQLDPSREPISGRVTDGRGRRQSFFGWLDLMDILDRARRNDPPASELRGPRGAQDQKSEEAVK
jgi:hypothetical protein